MSTELPQFLEQHPDIDAVQLLLTDPSGVARGKTVRRHELAALYRDGRNVAGSILGLDITGADVEATGLVWETGDADKLCRPVPGTLRARAVARAHRPGDAVDVRTRWRARAGRSAALPGARRTAARGAGVHARCSPASWSSICCSRRPMAASRPRAPTLPRPGRASASRPTALRGSTIWRPCSAKCWMRPTAQGLPAGTVMSEYAPGQFEITLQHRARRAGRGG